ncbi:YtxH domain-containing protein [Sorangium sp. So ce375]|jgi:gas vesicle protein|uniref:YtxH domain-containing protein n=1 Tax=Sorangium sp. So ce375 TaxID=3133306 RepID=UPI003F5B253F
MKADDLVNYMADMFPYKRRSSLDWIVPVSVGLGLGVAIGVGVGVLVAPTTGDEARRRLRDSTSRLRERAGHLREHAERAKDRALGAAQRTQDQIQEKLQETTGSYTNELNAR